MFGCGSRIKREADVLGWKRLFDTLKDIGLSDWTGGNIQATLTCLTDLVDTELKSCSFAINTSLC